MFTSKYELKKAGILTHGDVFTRPVRFEEIVGQESGVWFDYNGDCRDVRCDNFSGVEVVGEYFVDFLGKSCLPELVSIDVDYLEAADVIDGRDLSAMKENGATKEEIEALNSHVDGAFIRLTLRYYGCESEMKQLSFFAPEGWN